MNGRPPTLSTGLDDPERGVSDLVAFTLTFSIIIASIGFVSLYGIDTLEEMGDQSRVDTAQSSMYAVDATMDDLAGDGVPRRQLELDLGGDSLSRRNSELEVIVENDTDTSTDLPLDRNVKVGALVRESGQNVRFAYASGSMFRMQDRGSTVLGEPPLLCGNDTAHLSLVQLTGDVNVSTYGIAAVAAVTRERTSAYPDTANASSSHAINVSVDVSHAEYPAEWQRLDWDRRGWSPTGPGSDVYECTGIDRAYVTVTTVELRAVA